MTARDVYLQAARQRFDEGDFATAAGLCRDALRDRPDDGDLWQLCGTAYWELGLAEDAQEALETASCLKPLSPIAQCALAEVYTRANQVESAKAICANLAQRDDCPVPLMPRVARGLGRLGEHSLALQVCERIVALRPFHHPALFGVAFYKSALGAPPEEILPYVRGAYELAPNVCSYRVSLASLLAMLGRCDEAYEVAREVPAEQVHCPNCVRRLVPVFRRCKDRDRAVSWARWLGRLGRLVGGRR
jgi:tetratricopeptide (TPR) repeat protein